MTERELIERLRTTDLYAALHELADTMMEHAGGHRVIDKRADVAKRLRAIAERYRHVQIPEMILGQVRDALAARDGEDVVLLARNTRSAASISEQKADLAEAERDRLAAELAEARVQRDAARAIVARDLPELSRCTEVGGYAAIMGVEVDEYQTVKMRLREAIADRDRLAAVIRARHDRLCTADYTARGRHHPDCQLYELGDDAERAEARAFPEYAAGHPFCDAHPDDMPPAPQRCWQCEVVRLTAALADAQAETRRACAEELRRLSHKWRAHIANHYWTDLVNEAKREIDDLADRWAPAAPGGKEE